MSMEGATTNIDGVVAAEIIVLEEELTAKSLETFRAQVQLAFEKGQNQLILDCNKLRIISSEGLEAFLSLLEEAQILGGQVKIASLGREPRKVFEITQFNRIFELYDDVISALKNL
ncbi:MAG: STAS domain-containing protein [Planctomycetota bacterium]|jgi:anti-anti-sigma factor